VNYRGTLGGITKKDHYGKLIITSSYIVSCVGATACLLSVKVPLLFIRFRRLETLTCWGNVGGRVKRLASIKTLKTDC
jgi:hypothetical protein